MEKISLAEATRKGILSNSVYSSSEDMFKYTLKESFYKESYENIGKKRRLFRISLLFLSISSLFALFSSMPLNDFYEERGIDLFVLLFSLIVFICSTGYFFSCIESDALDDSIEYMTLREEVEREIIELHFNHLFKFAGKDIYIFRWAFSTAYEKDISEDKLEDYIKGFISQKLDEKKNEEEKRVKEINAVINYGKNVS